MQALPSVLPAAPAFLLRVLHLLAVIAPSLVLKFLMDCFVASSSWIVNGKFVSKKWSLIKKKKRQTRPLIPGSSTNVTRKGVVDLTHL